MRRRAARLTNPPEPFVLVLMPFSEKFEDVNTIIKTAAKEVGVRCERLDEQDFRDQITDRMHQQIEAADVIVAEITDQNPNVLYEVGYASALGKLLLLIATESNVVPTVLKVTPLILYHGSLTLLKDELVKKLRWAVPESARSPYEINISGEDVPGSVRPENVPPLIVHHSQPHDPRVKLPAFLGNASQRVLVANYVAYLYARPDCTIKPIVFVGGGSYVGYVQEPTLVRPPYDGLSQRYRLNVALPALPSGDKEVFEVELISSPANWGTEEPLLIEIVTPGRKFYFPFYLKIEPKTHGEAAPSERDNAEDVRDDLDAAAT